jgi:hypothetical protein
MKVESDDPNKITIEIRAANGQAVDMFAVKTYGGVDVFVLDKDGVLVHTGDYSLIGDFDIMGTWTLTGDLVQTGDQDITGDIDLTGDLTQVGHVHQTGSAPATITHKITGANGQTADLLVAELFNGTDLLRLDTTGLLYPKTGVSVPADTLTFDTTVEEGSMVSDANFFAFVDDAIVYVRNGATGEIDYSGADHNAVLQEALDALAVGDKFVFGKAQYNLAAGLVIDTADVTIAGCGPDTIFYLLPVVETTIASEATSGNAYIDVVSAAGFTEGMDIIIGDMTTSSTNWEMNHIETIVANRLNLRDTLRETYAAALYVGSKVNMITVTADYVTIRDLKVDGNLANQTFYPVNKPADGGGGIAAPVGNKNAFFRQGNNIYLVGADHCTIRNVVSRNASGWGAITLDNASHNLVQSNDLCYHNAHGIQIIYNSNENRVLDNLVDTLAMGSGHNLGHAIIVESNNTYNEDIADCNTVSNNILLAGPYMSDAPTSIWGNGIYILDSPEAVISGNSIYDFPYAIRIFGGDSTPACKFTITGNRIVHSSENEEGAFGIVIGSQATITGNYISGYDRAIWLLHDDSVIAGNVIDYPGVAPAGPYKLIGVSGCKNVAIIGNTVSSLSRVAGTGIDIASDASYISVVGNTVYYQYIGITDNGSYDVIANNVVSGCAVWPYWQSNANIGSIITGNRFVGDVELHADSTGLLIANNSMTTLSTPGSGNIIRDNKGYVTENSGLSVGTGAEQTIAHGLSAIPTRVILSSIDLGCQPYQSKAADATNIYITEILSKNFAWEAKVR